MEQIQNSDIDPAMLTLYVMAKRAFHMSKETGISKARRGHSIQADRITSWPDGRRVADACFQLLPKTWWLDQAETIVARAALQRLIGLLKENGIGCCMLPFGAVGWCFELNLDVSSPETLAVYCFSAGSAHRGIRPWENDVVIDVNLFTSRIDATIVVHVKLVDSILCDLLNQCMDQARTNPEATPPETAEDEMTT